MTAERNQFGQLIGFPVPDWKPPPLPAHEPMQGRFCRLEPLDLAVHADPLYAAVSLDGDDSSWTYLAYGPFPTLESYRAWMRATCTNEDPLFFAILNKTESKPVGVASYLRITPTSGSIEVGHLHYSRLLKRTPVATEAMYLMMSKAFELGYRRYEWKCNALNSASRAAAERLGFSFEGIFRQAAVHKGRNRDTAWYAVLNGEWPALREAYLAWLDPANFDGQGQQRSRLQDLRRGVVQQHG